jgi:hypothetical protein
VPQFGQDGLLTGPGGDLPMKSGMNTSCYGRGPLGGICHPSGLPICARPACKVNTCNAGLVGWFLDFQWVDSHDQNFAAGLKRADRRDDQLAAGFPRSSVA